MKIVLFLLLGIDLMNNVSAKVSWNEKVDFNAVERILSTGKITKVQSLKDFLVYEKGIDWNGTSPYYVVTIENKTHAVFRWEDEPWGSQAEVLGYRFSQYLNLDLVPPTVYRAITCNTKDINGCDWPGETKVGSLQLFIDASPITSQTILSNEDESNIEIISFILGRYDNHSGNLLVDTSGAPVLIDFENSLEIQKTRFGDFPFVNRGRVFDQNDGKMIYPPKPFPFDSPYILKNPSLEEIQKEFSDWWVYWPQGMEGLHSLLKNIPNKEIPYVLWNGRLWVQNKVRSRHPFFTDYFPEQTVKKLKAMQEQDWQDILIAPFGPRHLEGFKNRANQIIEKAKN